MKRLACFILSIFLSFSFFIQADDLFSERKEWTFQQETIKSLVAKNNKGILNSVIDFLGQAFSIAEDVAYTLLTPVQEVIKDSQPAIANNPYQNVLGDVRSGGPIAEGELEFRYQRFPKVKVAQEKLLGMKLFDDEVLEVAFACSGGGWRAMSCSLGSCVGADKIGLLDCVMCMSGLSGSTWFLGPWISSGLDIHAYKKRALDVICQGIDLQGINDIGPMLDSIWVKFAYNQPLNVIDIYGALLANNLLRDLGEDSQRVYLSDQRFILDGGDFPLPVYTATLGERRKGEFWFEFTPFEIGSRWLDAYVPSWSFGRYFSNGFSQDNAPEQSLGFLMAIFGSAFAADFEDLYDIIIDKFECPKFLSGIPFAEKIFQSVKHVFSKLAYSTDVGDLRVAWARVFNYVYNMKAVSHSNYRDLKLVDAGLDFNNPVFATYRRPPEGSAPDIIFVLDSGATVGFDELDRLESYAKEHGIKFPKIIHTEDIDKRAMTVFKDKYDPEVPIIIYMPRINCVSLLQKNNYKSWYDEYVDLLEGFDIERAVSSGFAHTFNFDYSQKQAEKIVAMTEFNMISSADQIVKIMRERIGQRRKAKKKG